MPKNITNGQFVVNFSEEDKVDQNFKFMRAPNNDSIETLRKNNQRAPISYFIQNIRTGQFTQISEMYMKQSSKEKSQQQIYTTNSFETEMKLLHESMQHKMNKGIFVGMALLYTITLSLSSSISKDLVRIQDQAIRIVSILSSFGSMYSFLIAKQRYQYIKTRGLSAEIDIASKTLILCTIEMIFYTLSYIIYNVSHTYAVRYNINQRNYTQLGQSTTIYTILCILGWVFTNVNTYKHDNY